MTSRAQPNRLLKPPPPPLRQVPLYSAQGGDSFPVRYHDRSPRGLVLQQQHWQIREPTLPLSPRPRTRRDFSEGATRGRGLYLLVRRAGGCFFRQQSPKTATATSCLLRKPCTSKNTKIFRNAGIFSSFKKSWAALARCSDEENHSPSRLPSPTITTSTDATAPSPQAQPWLFLRFPRVQISMIVEQRFHEEVLESTNT